MGPKKARKEERNGDVCGVSIVVRNGHSDPSSNPEQGSLHFI